MLAAIWASFTALRWVQLLWTYRKWIIAGVSALALSATIGWLKWQLHSAEAELGKAAAARAEDAATIGRLTDSIITLSEINRRNAALIKLEQDLAAASHADADKARERAAILDRSYTALIRSLDHASDNPPLNDRQRAYLRGLWCLGRGHETAAGCAGR